MLTGLTGGLGHTASALAHRYATAAVLGPFLYQQIIYMAIGGWLVFGQIPDSAVVLGAVMWFAAACICCGENSTRQQKFKSGQPKIIGVRATLILSIKRGRG